MVVTKDCGEDRMSSYCLMCTASVDKDWKIMEMDGGDSCTTQMYFNVTELYT